MNYKSFQESRTAKSLAKTAVLDASDNPDDNDEARKRRVKMDFESWRKQTRAGKTTHQEEVGISSAAAMAKARKEAELKAKEEAAVKKQKEATKKEEVQVEAKEETIDELNRYEKEKGKSTGSASYRSGVNTPRKGTPTKKGGSSDKIIHFAKGLVRGAEGRPTGQTRRSYDARGKETDRKESPKSTVTKRREARKRAIAFQQDTSGT